MFDCLEDVLKLTQDLVRVKSIVNTTGEKQFAEELYNLLASYPYFQSNPAQLVLERTLNDVSERYNVIAFVQGMKHNSPDTVILMGHLDTVGIDDYNQLKSLACDPKSLAYVLHNEDIVPLVKEHLNSGDWLFGRGVLDMKAGIASHLYLFKYYSEHPHELAGNLVFLAECDEEDSSHGMLSALKTLMQWKTQYNFNYIAAINSDFVSPRYEGDNNRYIYRGTVGKLLPSFFITGAETHVGSCFEGFDPNLLAAELTKQINYNPDLCDMANNQVPAPPVSLKQTDLKPSYTVQTALSSFAYYNFFVHSWTPGDVLKKLKKVAETAFSVSLETYKERYQKYCLMAKEPYREPAWSVKVLTYEELNSILETKFGQQYISHMTNVKKKLLLDLSLDVRMFSARVIEEAWNWMPDKSPCIILFYSSLYSPRVIVSGEIENETRLISALEQAIKKIQPQYNHPLIIRDFYPYISDMSFIAITDTEDDITEMSRNNPAWGTKQYIAYEDVRKLNVPVINIGPYGFDAHKKFERAEISYSMKIVPNLTKEVILNLLS